MKINVDTGVIMQKISFLLLGTSLSLVPQTLSATECAVTDCSLLGYTDSACPGSGLKCPFGDGWYCGGGAAEDCIKLGYDKSCTGAGYAGGTGETCNGKYQSCTCLEGYELKDGICHNTAVSCTIGTLYYSDGTCYTKIVPSKTLLGIVIYEKSTSANGWIMTINPILTNIKFSPNTSNTTNIPGLTNYETIPNDIQNSCTNTDKITAFGNSSTYPVAWGAKNYNAGNKIWCIPSGGLLNSIANTSILSKINLGIYAANGTQLGNINNGKENIWSSSKSASGNTITWNLYISSTNQSGMSNSNILNNYSSYSVRPVMAF